MFIGNRIKKLRLQYGYRQADLADLVGCSKQVISNIERNVTGVSADLASRIAYELHAPISEILPDCTDQPMILSEEERSLITEYRDLSAENRQLLRETLNLFMKKQVMGVKYGRKNDTKKNDCPGKGNKGSNIHPCIHHSSD